MFSQNDAKKSNCTLFHGPEIKHSLESDPKMEGHFILFNTDPQLNTLMLFITFKIFQGFFVKKEV